MVAHGARSTTAASATSPRSSTAARCALLALVVSPLGSERKGTQAWFQLGPFQLQPSELAKLALIVGLGRARGAVPRRARPAPARRPARPRRRDPARADHAAARPRHRPRARGHHDRDPARRRRAAEAPRRHSSPSACSAVARRAEQRHARRLPARPADDVPRPGRRRDRAGRGLQPRAVEDRHRRRRPVRQGLFEGTQTRLNNVPEQHTDFIFTAVGEELGFAGAGTLLALFAIVAWRVWRTAQLARDDFGSLICVGVLCMLLFQVFENVGMTMGIMPITGIPLPFVSYGGSSTLATFVAIGLVLNVHAAPLQLSRRRPIWPQLEHACCPLVQKPARYIGLRGRHGRAASTRRTRWRGCSPTPTPTRSACRTRACRSSTSSSTSATTPSPSAPTRPWTDLAAELRAQPAAAVQRRHPPAGRRLRRARLQPLGRARLHERPRVHRPRRHPAARRPARPTTTPLVDRRRATAPSTPSRSPTSSTPPCSATARRSSARSPRCCAAWKRAGKPAGSPRAAAPRPRRRSRASTSRRSTTCTYDGPRLVSVTPRFADVPERVEKRTIADLAAWPYPKQPARAAHRGRPRPPQRRGVPGLHPGLPVLPGRDDHPPGAGAPGRAGAHDGRRRPAAHRLRRGVAHLAVDRRLLRHRRGDRRPVGPQLAVRSRAGWCRSTCRACGSTPSPSASPPSSSRPGAAASPSPPRPGTWRMRQVINKLITEEDLYAAVEAAYSQGWRRMKLYFLTGLPTETDEDTLGIAELGPQRRRASAAARARARQVTVSVGGLRAQAPDPVPVVRPEHPRRAAAARSACCATTVRGAPGASSSSGTTRRRRSPRASPAAATAASAP